MYYSSNLTSVFMAFNEVLAKCKNVVPFNPLWKNGTGYLDGAVEWIGKKNANVIDCVPVSALPKGVDFTVDAETQQITVAYGKLVKGVDDYGRNFVFVSTRLGGVVVFERFKNANETTQIYVCNSSSGLSEADLYDSSSLNLQAMDTLFGLTHWDEKNIGNHVDQLFDVIGHALKSEAKIEAIKAKQAVSA